MLFDHWSEPTAGPKRFTAVDLWSNGSAPRFPTLSWGAGEAASRPAASQLRCDSDAACHVWGRAVRPAWAGGWALAATGSRLGLDHWLTTGQMIVKNCLTTGQKNVFDP